MVFVDFDREDFIFKSFWLNILSPARSSAFFMCTIFFLKINSSWRKIGFCVENTVENMVIPVLCVGIQSFTSRFRQYFFTKSKISPWWVDFHKKYDIHEKCGRASRTQNILSKVLRMKSSLLKSTKTVENCANYLLYGFLKELMMCRFCRFCLDLRFYLRLRISLRKSRIYQRILMIFFAKWFRIKS